MTSDVVETSPPPTRPWPDALRLLAFVLSVMVLFLAARQGQSQPVMYAAFAAFLVAATLWARGLDDNWIEGREDFRNWWISAGVVAVSVLGTAVVAAKADGSRSTYVLGALIAFYVLLGLAIRQLRWWVIDEPGPADQPWWERSGRWLLARMLHWQVLAVLVGAAYVGFWLLGGALMPLALVLLLAVVAVPAVVQVLSEQRIVALSAASKDDQRRLWILGGLLMLGIGLAIAAWVAFHQTLYVVAIVLVVAALAWSLAVGSLADIAVVLAVLALMGVTPGSQDVKPAVLAAPASGASQTVVVALGDSYSSGEGAERYLEKSNVAGGNQCRRAATAWPVLVAQAVNADRLVFRACSGARARNLVGDAAVDEQYAGEGIQVDRALRDLGPDVTMRPPALVLLSIGGNDSGFRQIGSSCLSMRSCDRAEISDLFYDNLEEVRTALRATYAAIATKFPASPIAVMPYPDAFATDDGCVRAPVEEGDIRFVRDFTGRLDGIIEKEATAAGLYYVAPMRSALAESKLALCDPSGTPGLNFLDFRGVGGAALNRFNPGNWIHNSLHPNERGHAALAAAFTGWLSSRTRVDEHKDTLTGLAALLPPAENQPEHAEGDGGPGAEPAQLPVPTKETSTLCFEKAGGGCGPKADAWALRQLAPGTVPVFLLAGWTAVGAWFLAIGFSALRFRRRIP